MMVSLGRDFSDYCPSWSSNLVVLLREDIPSHELADFAPGAVIQINARRTIGAAAAVFRIIQREQPSVIVSSLPHVSAAVGLATSFSRNGVRHIVRLESGIWVAQGRRTLGRMKSAIFRTLLSRADHYIVVSDEMKSSYASFLRKCVDSFTFIPNPIVFEPMHRDSRASTAWHREEIRLVAVGRLSAEKNFSLAVSIVDDLRKMTDKRVVLSIFGDGPLREELESDVLRRGLENNIFFRGFVHKKPEIYESGDILIVTSLYEGFPLNIIEALGFGLGVVSVDCDFGPREIILTPWQGSLSSYDPRVFAAAVLRFAESTFAKDEAMWEKRRGYAEANFSMNSVTSRHEGVFLSVMAPE